MIATNEETSLMFWRRRRRRRIWRVCADMMFSGSGGGIATPVMVYFPSLRMAIAFARNPMA
jgi:hypothetical protein